MNHAGPPHAAGRTEDAAAHPAAPGAELRLVFWELTARCNLACRHCRAEARDHAAPGELGTPDILRVAREIREAGDPILVLTGGEPLVHPDVFTIAGQCAQWFTRVALATNGTLVDRDMAARIARSGIRRVSISVDGATAGSHDAFRGQTGSYEAAWRGFDALRSAGISVQINTTVTAPTAAELPAILDLAVARGADAFHAFVLVPVGCGAELGAAARLSPVQMEDVLRWLFDRAVELRGRVHVKATCAPQYYRIVREVSRARGLAPAAPGRGMEAMTRGCLAGSAVCFVSRTGDVQPCGYLPVVAGNVRQSRFADIWRNADVFVSLRDPAALQGKCHDCGYRTVCAGCRARAFADTRDFLAADPDCAYVPS